MKSTPLSRLFLAILASPRDPMLLSFPSTTIIIVRCTVRGSLRAHVWQVEASGNVRKAWCKRDKSKFEVHIRGSIAKIGNVPIFFGSESNVFEEGRSGSDSSNGGAMIGVINAIIYGRLREHGRRDFERVRADRFRRLTEPPLRRVHFARVLSWLSAAALEPFRCEIDAPLLRKRTRWEAHACVCIATIRRLLLNI